MKQITMLTFVIIFALNIGMAQTMTIHTQSGENIFNLAEIDSITFTGSDEEIPISEVDTEMGGNLRIHGVVRDNSGNIAPNVYVTITVCEPEGGGDNWWLGTWELYTDAIGSYTFNNLLRDSTVGHYELWFNGDHEYGKVYENSGYWIPREEVFHDVFVHDVTVYPVTGSAFSGIIQYEDTDGTTKNFFSNPDNWVGLNRGTSYSNTEYHIGSEYYNINYSTGEVNITGLAGGTYFLRFEFTRSDGTWIVTGSPSFTILPGETKQFDYTVPLSPLSE